MPGLHPKMHAVVHVFTQHGSKSIAPSRGIYGRAWDARRRPPHEIEPHPRRGHEAAGTKPRASRHQPTCSGRAPAAAARPPSQRSTRRLRRQYRPCRPCRQHRLRRQYRPCSPRLPLPPLPSCRRWLLRRLRPRSRDDRGHHHDRYADADDHSSGDRSAREGHAPHLTFRSPVARGVPRREALRVNPFFSPGHAPCRGRLWRS
jgi:hypothetical protein